MNATTPSVSRRSVLAAALGSALPHAAQARAAKLDVLILGAGLSGLNAALTLEAAGLRVRVLEGSTRTGGRIHTLRNVAGAPETGGTQIGAAYTRTVAMAQRLGLPMLPNARSPLLRDEAMVMHVHGQRRSRAAWAVAADNPMPEAVRNVPPERALMRLIGASPLPRLQDWRHPANAHFDVPLEHELRARGIGSEALRLLDVGNAYGSTLAETSRLNLHYTQSNIAEILKTPGPVLGLSGGNQRLPEAMAAALRGDVLLSRAATAVSSDAHGVTARCTDGSHHHARFALCSLPLPAMRALAFEPGLPSRHAEAVQLLAYAQVTQLHLEVLRPFWQADGLTPYLWSDGPLERVFPQDAGGDGNASSLTVWINGVGTAAWDPLSDADVARKVGDEMAAVYPASRGAVRLARRVSWHRTSHAGGAWANWSPGQITRYASHLDTPVARLHFCGEHTAHGLRGIEGAMASGERAAAEILSRT